MKPLNNYQQYLVEEFVEDWREGHMSRRDMVKRVVYITGGAASAATLLVTMGCGPQATATAPPPPTTGAATVPAQVPTAAPTQAPTAAPKPTTAASPAASAAASPVAGSSGGSPTAAAAGSAAPKPAGSPAAQAGAAGARSPLSVPEGDPAVSTERVSFPGEAGTVFGYLAKPKQGSGPFAGLIVIHENRGLVPHIEDVARRAAKEGFVALAVDLLSRQGGTGKVTDPAQVPGLLGQAKTEDFVSDLSSGVEYLQTRSDVKKDKIGAFGFCFGGGYTWQLAANNKDVKAAVPFYGPNPPVDKLKDTNAAILAIYAGNDTRVNASMPQAEQALKAAGKTFEIKAYPGVNHAFHNDTGASWNEPAALDAWAKTMDWFKRYLA